MTGKDDDDDPFFSDEEEEEEVIDPETLGGDLYSAVEKNETESCLDYLAMGVPVDWMPAPSDGNNNKACKWSMLDWAAYHGNVDIVESLIAQNAQASYKEAKVADRLRKEGTIRGSTGGVPSIFLDTPLHKSSSRGHLRCVWLLLQSGYSLDDVDTVGNTPLHLAASGGRKDVVQCLCDHGANAGIQNNFKNTPANLCTNPSVRALLKVARSRPSMTKEEREDMQRKHLEQLSDLEESITEVDMDNPSAIDVDALEEKVNRGLALGVSSEVVEIGRSIVKELMLTSTLNEGINALKENSPIVTQTLFCEYVNALKDTVSSVETLISEAAENTEEGDGPVDTPLSQTVRVAQDLCKTAHSEYWLRVATSSVEGVECASEETVKQMGKLKESIAKAEMAEANEELVEEGKKVHRRLTAEVEVGRAKDGFPDVKLPVDSEEMTAKELKEYWLEEDPENPVNVGHIEETREWPKPPEDTGEYIWVPSKGYSSFKGAYDRLSKGLEEARGNGGDQGLVEEGEEVLKERAADMELLEGKNGQDRTEKVQAAEKLAKKLGKKKGGKKK